MPVPAGTGLSRRSFIARTGGLALAVFGGGALRPAAWEEGIAAAAAAGPERVLVSIFMSGGVDSLSMLAPLGDPRYASLRPTLGVADSGVAEDVFTEDDRLRWHPDLAPIRDLHRAGKVTVIPAIGYDDPNQSHFTSRHYWEVGELNPVGRVGWMGRFLDRHGVERQPAAGALARLRPRAGARRRLRAGRRGRARPRATGCGRATSGTRTSTRA